MDRRVSVFVRVECTEHPTGAYDNTLNKTEQTRINEIGLTNTRTDFTLVNGNVMLAFLMQRVWM